MGFVIDAIKWVAKTTAGLATGLIGFVGSIFGGKKKSTPAQSSSGRLNKSVTPEDFRKIVFGKTASATDVRYWEVYGTSGTQYDEVIAMACHQINSVKEFYAESDLALDASNTPQGKYSGVLTRAYKLGAPGQTALSVGGGTQWLSTATMTGVAHMVLKWVKNDDKLPNGPPSRYTNIIEGALVYDPRRDSTQPGGSGSHRYNDQSTWDYATTDSNGVPIGRNNALQALWYLLGWRVQNPVTNEWVLVAGRGIDPNDINFQTFITGANNCEAAGYYTDMILSTEDEHTSNEDKITADGLIATLIDPGGLWSYYANVDDTASVSVYLTDNDILDTAKVSWNEYKGMSEQYNQVVGKFIDPSATALFQPRAYPMVRDATYESNLGVKRRKAIDFEQIQDALLAQKLARLCLNQGQFQAEFTANFSYRALRAQAWSIVSYTSERFGWTKLFRVQRYSIAGATGVGMTLREVHPSIWTAGSVTAPVTAPLGTRYDPTQAIPLTGLGASAYTGTGADGTVQDGVTIAWTAPPANVRRTEVQVKLTTDTYWQSYGPYKADVIACNVFPLLSNSVYNVRARHVSVHEVAGAWVNLSGNFTVGNNTNVGFATIDAKANTFRQATPPTTGTVGDYWTDIDDNNASYRHEGLGLFVGGVPITFNGNGTTFDAPWVSILDQQVLNTLTQVAALNVSMAQALASVASIASDNVLSRGEKPEINRQYNLIVAEYPVISARASLAGITTQLTDYTTAYNSLIAYLGTLTRWQDPLVDTPIVGSSFDAAFVAYYSAASILNTKIAEVAAQTATWTGVTGTGKPADNATVGAPSGTNVAGRSADDIANTISAGGGVAPNKVTASSLDNSVVQEIGFTSNTNITATDAGVLLVQVDGIDAKPAQGGRVIISLTADIEGSVGSSITTRVLFAILQRSPAGANTWTQVGSSWRMYCFKPAMYAAFTNYDQEVYDAAIPGYKVPVSGGYALLGLRMGVSNNYASQFLGLSSSHQWLDNPPSDASYDYRVLACKTNTLGSVTAPEVGAATATAAQIQAISIKVAV